MTRLVKDARRKVFLVLDNLRVHHGKIVKQWLKGRKEQIEVFYLPSCSSKRPARVCNEFKHPKVLYSA